MSLDVSPDGTTIVFDLLGDLFILPIVGGRAIRITSGMAFNRQPRFSPDGRRLAFVSDRGGSSNVWVADRNGGNPRQISRLEGYAYGAVTSPTWSPDGQTLVVSQMLGASRPGPVAPSQLSCWLLASYGVRSGRMEWISDTAPAQTRSALGAVFGPEGADLYAAVDTPREDWFSQAEDWRLARVDMATGRVRLEMSKRALRVGMRPALSPNGRYLVYASSSGSRVGLRIRDLETDDERWLAREVLDDPPALPSLDSRDLVPGYAFTPDSRSIVIAYQGKIHRIEVRSGQASRIPFVASVERPLGPMSLNQFALPDTATRTRGVLQPALSPDGKRVAFSALDRLWLMELPHDGQPAGQPRRLTADSIAEFYPSWAPDGRWIAYSTWTDGAGGAVRRVSVTEEPGRAPPSERLTSDTAIYFHTAVSSDGRRIVAVRAGITAEPFLTTWVLPDTSLVWLPAGGGRPARIGSLAADQAYRPQYPVQQVYFRSDPARVYVGLTSWRLDGPRPRIEVSVRGQEDFFLPYETAGVLSPAADRALIARKYALFEISLPPGSSGPGAAAVPGGFDLEHARTQPFGARLGAARRWSTALAPWISWSRDGRRVLFSQGGTLFVGDVRPNGWTAFTRIDVPLMVPVDTPRGAVALRGARLITMAGRTVIESGDILVRNNRIVAVGPTGQVAIPSDARVIDLTGATILPGFVDLHDHVLWPRGVHPQQFWHCLAQLAYGVTAIRDPEPFNAPDVFVYRERERMGDLLGPRVFSTGIAYNRSDPPVRTLEEARDVVRPNAEFFGSETFKLFHDPSVGRRARQLLAMAVREQGLNATVEAGGNAELELTTVIDGFSGLEHAFPVRLYEDVALLFARGHTTTTQTYGTMIPGSLEYLFRRYGGPWEVEKMRRFAPPSARASMCPGCAELYDGPVERENLVAQVAGAGRIAATGGSVAMGAHGDIPGLGPHYELWLYTLGGMPNHEVLRSATIVGAAAIGHERDFGSLEAGKLADLQVLDRNPLLDIRNTTSIRYVMKNGRLYRTDDLCEIWPRRRCMSPIYNWTAAPTPNVTSVGQWPRRESRAKP